MRIFQADSNRVELQVAMKKFVPANRKGPAIWMTGVCHIGESNYYALLQEHLDEQTLVLYEGIGDAAVKNSPGPPPSNNTNSSTGAEVPKPKLGTLQFSIADSLGLMFQLEAIDYERSHFRNSDLSIEQIRELMTETGGAQSFNGLVQMMEGGGSWLDSLLQISLRFLGTNPRLQALSKLMLLEVLGQLEGDLEQLALPPEIKRLLEVLIARRNEKVVLDLKLDVQQLRRRDSIAVFYGIGHMPDLEKRLRQELQYQPIEQRWFTAFSVDLAQAAISPGERQFIQGLVKRQLEQLQPQPRQKLQEEE